MIVLPNINYFLGIIDGIMCIYAFAQLIRIKVYTIKNGGKNLKPKEIFHFIIAVTMLVRSAFFFALATSLLQNQYSILLIWFIGSSIMLFVAYACLLLFWMELYSRFAKPYLSSSDFWTKWKPYIYLSSMLLVLAIISWSLVLVFWAKDDYQKALMDVIGESLVSVLFLVAGFGFLLFGILFYRSFRIIANLATTSSTILIKSQMTKPPPEAVRAAIVGIVCTFCFSLRAIVTLYNVRLSYYDPEAASTTKFDWDWEFELLYFAVTEILPTILMMFRLRKMKKPKTATNINVNNNNYKRITSYSDDVNSSKETTDSVTQSNQSAFTSNSNITNILNSQNINNNNNNNSSINSNQTSTTINNPDIKTPSNNNNINSYQNQNYGYISPTPPTLQQHYQQHLTPNHFVNSYSTSSSFSTSPGNTY